MSEAHHWDGGTDTRITGEFVRSIPGSKSILTLVGVVHDHPASVYRVRRVVETIDPATLALELPPIAVPLFVQYARDERIPPRSGGEMSAAIQAAETDTTVGIDRPTWRFFARLARNLVVRRPSWATVRTVLSNTGSATRHAMACWMATTPVLPSRLPAALDREREHETDWGDSPDQQAADERRQIRRSRSFANALEPTATTRASRIGDGIREEHMADRLANLQRDGDVVAIVGIDHLDSLVELLGDPNER
ncbi:MAG: hypothetical protein ACOCPT_00690 [Halanaeroarchaeum sp.]